MAVCFDGRGNHLIYGAANFFVAPNFADTYNPPLLQLHNGACSKRTRALASAPPPEVAACSTPAMPSMERMRQIVAANPRAQAKFFLLMTELCQRCVMGLEHLHVSRVRLARPLEPPTDDVDAPLQPSVAPGVVDVQATVEAQGRGRGRGRGIV